MKVEGLPQSQQNVFGEPIELCCNDPLTGFYRDGHCNTGPNDLGTHTVCALMTDEFLEYSAAAGNDLSTPRPEFNFPGLVAGNRWCPVPCVGSRRTERGKHQTLPEGHQYCDFESHSTRNS